MGGDPWVSPEQAAGAPSADDNDILSRKLPKHSHVRVRVFLMTLIMSHQTRTLA